MAKRNSDNLRIKLKYSIWRQDARGLAVSSIDRSAAAITLYDDWLDGKDFRAFHPERARAFKRYLGGLRNERTGAQLGDSTINSALRELKAFFNWLADQPGYKSRITRSDVDYLTPDRKSENARRRSLWQPHPSPEQVLRSLSQMPVETAIKRRNRALVAILFLSGSREETAISLEPGHVDLAYSCVQFDGRVMNTKFGKSFTTAFYPFDPRFEGIVSDWIAELRGNHFFANADPLFPKTQVGLGPTGKFAAAGISRDPWAGASGAAKIFKEAFANAGFPPFSPHKVRDTVADLARQHCRTPEDYKAWSQNMGHNDVLTTFRSYELVAPGRQMELMRRFRAKGPVADQDIDLFE